MTMAKIQEPEEFAGAAMGGLLHLRRGATEHAGDAEIFQAAERPPT